MEITVPAVVTPEAVREHMAAASSGHKTKESLPKRKPPVPFARTIWIWSVGLHAPLDLRTGAFLHLSWPHGKSLNDRLRVLGGFGGLGGSGAFLRDICVFLRWRF